MTGKQSIILAFAVLAALTVGLYVGATEGIEIGRTQLEPQIQDNAEHIAALECNLAAANDRLIKATELMTFVGVASWYGDREQGKPTSLGKPFDKNALTAASKFLPYHSYWYVTNLENGKQVGVFITDDGPNVPGRYLDLSEAAAKRLELKRRGTGLTAMSPWLIKPGAGD